MIELIVQRYRKELTRYVLLHLTRYVLLHMHRGKADAEDIVQEVFFALYKKQNISVDENIRAWLYETARYKIMEYNRNNPQFDEVTEEISAPDDGFPDDISGSIFEGVSDEEYALLKSYFMGEDKNELAARNGMTVNALYCKVMRIKKKIEDPR